MGVVLAFERPTHSCENAEYRHYRSFEARRGGFTPCTLERTKHVQRFTFVDIEKISLCVSLWEEMITLQGPMLIEAARTLSVVFAKRLGISSYKVNPPLEAAKELKSWIDSKSEVELDELHVDQSITISKEFVEKGDLKIHTVSELANIVKSDEYWTIARPLVAMLISDQINTVKVFAIDNGQHYDVDTIKAELHGKIFMMLLRHTFGQQSESQRKMLLIAYYDETNSAEAIQSSILPCSSMLTDSDANTSGNPLSPLKREMSQITLLPGINMYHFN
ncbi:hypothetical protein LIER_12768 [Lithospermum erythrorhizon]|uniref:Uncharacterized protein n=1 Tax=Lithospermum erythrorhizon TaxID=34254 RepID=A0AAV3PX46_LITER